MVSQGILFSQECIAETGLWCELAPGIDPTQWARVCRFLGHLSPERFQRACQQLHQLCSSKSLPTASTNKPRPLVSLGPSGIGGEYQKEWL